MQQPCGIREDDECREDECQWGKAKETWVPKSIFKPLNQALAGDSSTCWILNKKLLYLKKLIFAFSAYL